MISSGSNAGNYIIKGNQRYSYFAGNNYLGLANHPVVINEAILALKKYGLSFAASRLTTGTSEIHLELEKLLAEFKGRDQAIIFASGYLGNSLLLDALKSDYTEIFADSMSHSSILDGIPKEVSKINFYNHCDANHLESLLKKVQFRPLIITDGIFALSGDITPLDQIYILAKKYDAVVIVDDAHATGILGNHGRGTPEHFNLNDAPNLYQSETMSKALGAYGGFISSGNKIIHDIRTKSTFYGATTALPLAITAAGCASIKYLQNNPDLRQKLQDNTKLIRNGIRELGFLVNDEITPIIPISFNKEKIARHLSNYLEENHIIAPCIDYPVKMEKFVVRITASASHTKEQIENFLLILKDWKNKNRMS